MKTTLITLLASLFFLAGFSQDPRYQVRSKSSRPVTKVSLKEAKRLSDFIPGYPVNWISSYAWVEIMATHDGMTWIAMGKTDALTTEQKNILKTVELGTDIIVNVSFNYTEAAYSENKEMRVSMTVTPEVEAEFVGGQKQLSKYFEENVADKMSKEDRGKFQDGIAMFSINEEGEVINARISKTSGDPTIDRLFVEALNNMPKWKPARDAKGVKVKQEFYFSVGNAGSGGC